MFLITHKVRSEGECVAGIVVHTELRALLRVEYTKTLIVSPSEVIDVIPVNQVTRIVAVLLRKL